METEVGMQQTGKQGKLVKGRKVSTSMVELLEGIQHDQYRYHHLEHSNWQSFNFEAALSVGNTKKGADTKRGGNS